MPFSSSSTRKDSGDKADKTVNAAAPVSPSGTANSTQTPALDRAKLQAHARELANFAPTAQREAVAQAYLQSFEGFLQLERKLGLPENDMANGLAAFIAGNYMALNQVEVPDAHFARLAGQLREAMPKNPGFQTMTAQAKRKLYEQSAMQGMFMALARLAFLKQPQAAAEQNYRPPHALPWKRRCSCRQNRSALMRKACTWARARPELDQVDKARMKRRLASSCAPWRR